jgi:hypothetical protein
MRHQETAVKMLQRWWSCMKVSKQTSQETQKRKKEKEQKET